MDQVTKTKLLFMSYSVRISWHMTDVQNWPVQHGQADM